MAKSKKLKLSFPHALAIEGANLLQRRLIMLAHLCLITNGLFLIFGIIPLGGIVAAFGVLMVAKSRADAAGIPAVRHGLIRCINGLIVVLFAWGWQLVWAEVLPAPAAVWLLVPLIQVPLGLADARNVWRGGIGWRMLGLEKF